MVSEAKKIEVLTNAVLKLNKKANVLNDDEVSILNGTYDIKQAEQEKLRKEKLEQEAKEQEQRNLKQFKLDLYKKGLKFYKEITIENNEKLIDFNNTVGIGRQEPELKEIDLEKYPLFTYSITKGNNTKYYFDAPYGSGENYRIKFTKNGLDLLINQVRRDYYDLYGYYKDIPKELKKELKLIDKDYSPEAITKRNDELAAQQEKQEQESKLRMFKEAVEFYKQHKKDIPDDELDTIPLFTYKTNGSYHYRNGIRNWDYSDLDRIKQAAHTHNALYVTYDQLPEDLKKEIGI